jgi:hypothetical protein
LSLSKDTIAKFEPSEDNDRELISAFCNELSKNESVNLKVLHLPYRHGSSELLNDIYSVGETLAHLMWSPVVAGIAQYSTMNFRNWFIAIAA